MRKGKIMFKKIYKRIEMQDKEIEALKDKLWDIENPYGKLARRYNMYCNRIVYMPSRKVEVSIESTEWQAEYKIKKTLNATYIFLRMKILKIGGESEVIERTYAVKGDACVQIDNPVEFDTFDKQGAI